MSSRFPRFRNTGFGWNFAVSCVCFLIAMPCGVTAQQGKESRAKEEAAQAEAAGNDGLAETLYARALAQDSTWTDGWWKYGGLLYQARKFQAADDAFTHLTRLAPSNPLGVAMLGMCEYELGDWNNASLHLNKAFAHGGLPEGIANAAMFNLGLTLMRQHNRSGALIAFRLLQRNAPAFPSLVPALGSAELGLQQMPESGGANSNAVLLAGQAAIAVLNLKSDDADRLYRQLVQEYPTLPDTHLCLALFLENIGKHAEAEAELKAEAAVNPGSPDAWIWLARLALARRDAAATLNDVSQAVRLTPNDGVCFLLSGRAYILQQQWSKALTDLQKAEAMAPDSYEVHHALISVYSELHDPQGAAAERKLFAQTFALSHPPQTDGQ